MNLDEYITLDATALASQVRNGLVDRRHVWKLASERFLEQNSKINAVVEWFDQPDFIEPQGGSKRPLEGVPILAKDYGSAVAGRLVQMGSRLGVGNRATVTSLFMSRLMEAGAQIVGRSAVPEFIQHGTTESQLYGTTRNPYDLSMSAGGSSGGAGASVAAGIVPAAHASDCAGSIRIPAAANGLYGLKPARDAIAWQGATAATDWEGIAAEFMLCKSLRDVALFFEVLSASNLNEPANNATVKLLKLAASVENVVQDRPPTAPLRVALSTNHWAGAASDSAVVNAATEYAEQLEKAGHTVEEIEQPVDYDQLASTWNPFFSSAVAAEAKELSRRLNRPINEEFCEPITLEVIEAVENMPPSEVEAAHATRTEIGLKLDAALEGFDVLVTPTLGRPTIPLGVVGGQVTDFASYIKANDELFPYSYLFNLTGWPSLSVPIAQTGAIQKSSEMPLGVQISAGSR